jgi:hypothetical protein
MQDSLSRRFFLEPHQSLHRRYEALRAVFVDGQPQWEVAKHFGSLAKINYPFTLSGAGCSSTHHGTCPA